MRESPEFEKDVSPRTIKVVGQRSLLRAPRIPCVRNLKGIRTLPRRHGGEVHQGGNSIEKIPA